jgi:hypothetical protein
METNQTSQPSMIGQAKRQKSMQSPKQGVDAAKCIFYMGQISEGTSGDQWINCVLTGVMKIMQGSKF